MFESFNVGFSAAGAVNFPPDVKMWGQREVGFLDIRLGCPGIRHKFIGPDFLFRHEAYVLSLEYGAVLSAPEQPATLIE